MDGDCAKYHHRFVIVGAGIAGLSAACALLENDVDDVLILEAQDRVGGRVCTIEAGDGIIELGAQWVHGERNNPIFDICKQHDLVDSTSVSFEAEGEYRTSDGKRVEPSLIEKAKQVIQVAYDNCTKFTDPTKDGQWREDNIPQSVEEFFRREFFKVFDVSDPLHRGLFHWLMLLEKCENACDTMAELSPASWGEWQFCEGEWKINLKRGYKSVVDMLVDRLAGLGKGQQETDNADDELQPAKYEILLNEPVIKIEWLPQVDNLNPKAPGKLAWVTTASGKSFGACHVIVTASLGFLKENLTSLFSPPLPEKVNRAIETLGYGVIDKVFLEFPAAFWNEGFKGIQTIWTDVDLESVAQRDVKLDERWIRAISGFDPVIKQPNMLLCWIGGEEARHMEKLLDHEVIQVLWLVLKRFTGKNDIPEPSKIHRSNWWSNAYFRGSFSYRNLASDAASVRATDLAEPACCVDSQDPSVKVPVVMLAGEAQHLNHYTTVHGAYGSGKEVVAQLLLHQQDAESTSTHSEAISVV